jgi:hypothetical protein
MHREVYLKKQCNEINNRDAHFFTWLPAKIGIDNNLLIDDCVLKEFLKNTKEAEMKKLFLLVVILVMGYGMMYGGDEWWKPYSPPCTERENVFEFTEKPKVRMVGPDRYEITFAVKGYCDVTVAIIDPDPKKELVSGRGIVVRHLGAGVLGPNAPSPFQKNSLKQVIYWDGKDDLGVYVKEPEKLCVRVMLGLNPVFDKQLGGTSPYNMPGIVCGIAIGPEGAVVFSKGWRLHARRFNHDGEYVMSLLMPPANLPEEKLAGLGYVEYEPGKKAPHAPNAYESVADRGRLFWGIGGDTIYDFQAGMYGERVYFLGFNGPNKEDPSPLYWLRLDGATEFKGIRGTVFAFTIQRNPRLAVSPDGKWLYMVGTQSPQSHAVWRRSLISDISAEPFLGKKIEKGKKDISIAMGNEDGAFNMCTGIDCDAEGRIYVCDLFNNRVQIFTQDGKHLKNIVIDRPALIQVHKKTGEIYVFHSARVHGRSVSRITKFNSFDDPREVFHFDGTYAGLMALDSWSKRPRLWLAQGRSENRQPANADTTIVNSVLILEDDGLNLRKFMDFDERAAREDGPYYGGRRCDPKCDKLVCDPVREIAYYQAWEGPHQMFDLRTGKFLGVWQAAPHRSPIDDIAFDRRGYMHLHFNPYFYITGCGRVDPSQPSSVPHAEGNATYYPEVPYDYGIEGYQVGSGKSYWKGILPLKDQGGPHGFQFGIGVNMGGDVAVVSQIYYVPKIEDMVKPWFSEGFNEDVRATGLTRNGPPSYEAFLQRIQDMEKRGESVYFIKPRPGIPLAGSTIWTFDRSGKLREACAANMSDSINGVEIDEDGDLYFVCNKIRVKNGKPFLAGRGGTFGGEADVNNRNPMTGTLMRTRGKDVVLLVRNAMVPMESWPDRPPDVINTGYAFDAYDVSTHAWVEGAKWMYAGASPIRFRSCHCPQMRFRTDWYRRTFVPEAYRHSVGVVDCNGNLIMHIGQYGNFDSASGPKSKIPVGKDGIAFYQPRCVSATDNYIAVSCSCVWITVLRIEYHAEATAEITQ